MEDVGGVADQGVTRPAQHGTESTSRIEQISNEPLSSRVLHIERWLYDGVADLQAGVLVA